MARIIQVTCMVYHLTAVFMIRISGHLLFTACKFIVFPIDKRIVENLYDKI